MARILKYNRTKEMPMTTPQHLQPILPAPVRRLLAVGREGPSNSQLKAYALELGARMGCEVVQLTLVPNGVPQTGAPLLTPDPAGPNPPAGWTEFKTQAQKLAPAVDQLCRTLKRIELILTDSDSIKESLSETQFAPVFHIVETKTQTGGKRMSSPSTGQPAKPIGKTIALGALTAALYGVVFWKADAVMNLFTRGGVYAALPIATVFVFSFAHGAFASNLWSLLGIQAKPTVEAYKSVSATAQPTKTKTSRPRARAYVNPFHNIDLKSK
jgi:hypothetical protein